MFTEDRKKELDKYISKLYDYEIKDHIKNGTASLSKKLTKKEEPEFTWMMSRLKKEQRQRKLERKRYS